MVNINTLRALTEDVEILAKELKAAGALKGGMAALKAERDAAYAAHMADIDPATGDAPYKSKLLWQKAESEFKEAMKRLAEAHELAKPEAIRKGTPVAGQLEGGIRVAWRKSNFPGILKIVDPRVWWASSKSLTIGVGVLLVGEVILGYGGLVKTIFNVDGVPLPFIGGRKIPFTNARVPENVIDSFAGKEAAIKQHAEQKAVQEYQEHKITLGQNAVTTNTSMSHYAVDATKDAGIVNGKETAGEVLTFLSRFHREYASASLEALPSQTQIIPFFFHNDTRDVATVDAPGKGKCVVASLDGAIILIPLESYKAAGLPMQERGPPKADLGKPPSGPEQGPPTPPPRADIKVNSNGGAAPGGTAVPNQTSIAARAADSASLPPANSDKAAAPDKEDRGSGGMVLAGMALAIPAEKLIQRTMKTEFMAGAAERFVAPVSKTAVRTLERLAGPALAGRVMKAAHFGGAEIDPLIGAAVFFTSLWAGSKLSDALHTAGQTSDTVAMVEGIKQGKPKSVFAGAGALAGTVLGGMAAGFVCSLPAEGLSPWVGVPVQIVCTVIGAFLGKEGVTMAYDKVAGYLKTGKPQIGVVNIMPKVDAMRPSRFGFGPQGMTPAYNA